MRYNGAEAVDLGTGNGVSVLELVRAFEAADGRKLPFAIRKLRRSGDFPAFWAAAEKARSLLAGKPRTPWRTCTKVRGASQKGTQTNKLRTLLAHTGGVLLH